jgi:peptide/nickel transport system substrate-binding protein
MRKHLLSLALLSTLFVVGACRRASTQSDTITMVIDTSPTNLDPRIGTDGSSEHIDSLIFDALVHKDEHYAMQPALAVSWEMPDPLTCIFHLRAGVHLLRGMSNGRLIR